MDWTSSARALLQDLDKADRIAVSSDFGRVLGEVNKGMAEAEAHRKLVQDRLRKLALMDNHSRLDVIDSMSVAEIRDTQNLLGTTPDGIWGPKTEEALNRRDRIVPSPLPPRREQYWPRIDVTSPPESMLTPEERVAQERDRQAGMAFGVAPAAHIGWIAVVSLIDGRRKYYWRPTKKWARYIGRYVLEREIRKRQRLFLSQNPEMTNALKLRIIEPTQAEENAADISEWTSEFNRLGGSE